MLPLPEPTPTRQLMHADAGWDFTPNPHSASYCALTWQVLI
nr:MAG TPA: hypothetical protein [Caudoviricetes sp.]